MFADPPRSAMIQDSDLQDGQKIFMLQEGKFWPAKLNTTQLPDVYSIILEKQRGNRPIILPRDDILNEAVSFIGFHFIYFVIVRSGRAGVCSDNWVGLTLTLAVPPSSWLCLG